MGALATESDSNVSTIKTAQDVSSEKNLPTEDYRKPSQLNMSTSDISEIPLVRGKTEIRAVRYAFYSKRFWMYLALMVLGNFFGTFFSYSYKLYGGNDHPHK